MANALVAGLVADALHSVVSDADTSRLLSTPSRAFIALGQDAFEKGTGSALNQSTSSLLQAMGDEIAQEIMKALTGSLQSVLGELGGAANAIPFVGAAIQTVLEAWTFNEQLQADRAARAAAALRAHMAACAAEAQALRPVGTGAGGSTTPSDIFGRYFGPSGPLACQQGAIANQEACSLLGQMLILVTEGGSPDRYDAGLAREGWPFDDWQTPAAHAARKKGVPGAEYWGVDPKRRAQFASLRKAMAALWCQPGTDGGRSLWPVYMDLVASEISRGAIPYEYGKFLLGHQLFYPSDGGRPRVIPKEKVGYCTPHWVPVLDAIYAPGGLYNAWDLHVLRPVNSEDVMQQQKLAQIVARLGRPLGKGRPVIPHVLIRGSGRFVRAPIKSNPVHVAASVGLLGAVAGIGWRLLV